MQDLTTTMAVTESFVDYRKSRSSDNASIKDSHDMGGGEEVSPNVIRREKGKVSYNQDKGKGKQWESVPRLRCSVCDGLHLVRESPKREAHNALIKKREKEEDAHLGSM